MADVFISYAREDRAQAELVARGLSAMGLDSFWDTDIPPGQTWADYIESKLGQCKTVAVLWSEHSTKSQWVREEARMGRDKSKLIPARLDNAPAPFGFGEVQAADLSTWRGEANHPEWVRFANAVRNAVAAAGGAPDPASAAPPPQPAVQSGWRSEPPRGAPQPNPQHQQQHQTFAGAGGAAGAPEHLSPVGYVQKCLRMFVNGQGRARRAEFWWWTLFTVILAIVAAVIDIGIGGVNPYTSQPNTQILSTLLSLALLAPNVSLMSRRLHDIGMNGWIAAAIFGVAALGGFLVGMQNPLGGVLFFIAGVFGLVVALIPSKAGPNQYGPNPKGL
jgi:uncharacterized membrane protein YhaH (DUF805 family)